jgi:predicted nuclease with TOPRIM domain
MEIIIGLASGALITAIVALVQQFRLSDKVKALGAPKEEGGDDKLKTLQGDIKRLEAPFQNQQQQLDDLRWQLSMMNAQIDKSKVHVDQLSEPKLVVVQPDLDGVTPPTPVEKLEEEAGTVYSRYFIGGIQRRYAPAPNRNGVFIDRQLTETPSDRSNFELIILEPASNIALYRLYEDPVQLKRAIKNPKTFIIPACQLIGRGGIERAQALECTFGIAKKDDKGNWQITKKSIIKYNMNMPEVYQGYEDELEQQYQQFIPLSKKEFQEKWDAIQAEREALRQEAQKIKKAATTLTLQMKNLKGQSGGDDALVRELVKERMQQLQKQLENRISAVESKPNREELRILLDGGIQALVNDLKKDFVTQKDLASLPKGEGGGITPQGVRNIIREELLTSGLVSRQELKELFRRYDQRIKKQFSNKSAEPLKDDFKNLRNDFNDTW